MSATTDHEDRDMLTETQHDIDDDQLSGQLDDDLDLLALITLEDEETGAVAEDLQAAGLL